MESLLNAIIPILLLFIPGVVFLLLGRRIFWLLGGLVMGILTMGILSFFLQPEIVDIELSESRFSLIFDQMPNLPPILIGSLIGVAIGIALTLRFPTAACGLVGFVSGAFLIWAIFNLFAVNLPEPVRRTLYLLGGVAVAYIGIRNKDQTMILLTTLLGAGLVLQGLRLDWEEPIISVVWLVLMLGGIIFQTNSLRLEQRKAASSRTTSLTARSQN